MSILYLLILAVILVGGLLTRYAVKIGFYEMWAMFFNIVIAIYVALYLTQHILDNINEANNIPCCHALTLMVLAIGTFLILHGITYVLFTSQFMVTFPKIFDVLFAGFLGFFTGYLVLSFAIIIIALTPFGERAGITKDLAKKNMSFKYNFSYCLFDGINWFVSPPEKNIKSQEFIEQFIGKSEQDTPDEDTEQAEPNNSIKPDGT